MSTTLQTEIKQSRPFDSPEEEAFLNVLRTAAVLEHTVSERIRELGVTLTQYNVLRILRGAGPEGLCRNDVRDRMIKAVPDATRLLDRLEDQGLVERSRDGSDRRFVTARITASGLALLEELDGPIADTNRSQLGHLSRAELQTLNELLVKARSRRE